MLAKPWHGPENRIRVPPGVRAITPVAPRNATEFGLRLLHALLAELQSASVSRGHGPMTAQPHLLMARRACRAGMLREHLMP